MDHPASQTPTARAAHCHSTHLCARPSCACSADTHFPGVNFNRIAIELSFDLADNFWRYAHLWTEKLPMVPVSLGLVAVEGIAFFPEVAEACLGAGVTCTAESHVYHCCAPCHAYMLLK
jgi:hypothetical protein